ncbi:MucBP domain-containing protein [Enterococcus cecorum]
MKMRGKQANTVGRRFKGFYAFVTLIVLVSNFVLPIHQLVLYADETSPTTGPTAATTANDKVTISNVKFDKSTVYEYYGLNIVVSFDWEGKGLQKGDTLITPMSEAFDSITKTVNYKFSDGNGNELGTMTLDYNHREIRTTFTADMDPQRIYSGTIRIGTYINRNFFTELDSTKTIRIPIPHGDPIEIPLRVKFESYIPGYDIGKTYVNAVEQILSKDQKHAEVLWHGLVNVKHLTMKDLALYASPKLIERVYRVGSMPTGEVAKPENRVNLVYNTAQSHPFTMEPDSFGVFEAETTYESMGYIKGKRLEYGKDYKIIPGIPGDKNGYIFHLIGDYATTDKSIIMEGKALYDNLPVDSTGIGVSQETFVTGNAAISYFDNYGNLQTGDYNAVVNVTDSDVTNISVNDENKETGSVTVVYVTDTGKTLAQEEYVQQNQPLGTPYQTEKRTFEGYVFKKMAENSASPSGEVTSGRKTVIYMYTQEQKGNVDVKYIDLYTGNELTTKAVEPDADDVYRDGKVRELFAEPQTVGTPYETIKHNFKGYRFVRMGNLSAEPSGVVTKEEKHVIYMYEPIVNGIVDVTYIDIDTGQPISVLSNETKKDGTTRLVTKGDVGTNYATIEETFPGYTFVRMGVNSAPATGEVLEKIDQHVIYAYRKTGSVDVKYVDEQGNELPGGEVKSIKTNAPVGESYTTEQKTFTGYTFKGMDKTSSPTEGKVIEGTQHVIYVYTKIPEAKTGSVDVKFVDKTTGEIIEGTSLEVVKDDVPVGEGYYTTPKDLTDKGYQFVGVREGSDDPAGLIVEGTKHVVYEYEKIPEPIVKKGSVDVKYVDRATGEVLPFDEATVDNNQRQRARRSRL